LSKNQGKQFEEDLMKSCKKQNIFYDRIKDTFIPPDLRDRVFVSKNKFDNYIFKDGWLFPLELKSSGQKSISFDEKIIKQHQIDSLYEATKYNDQIIPGFLFNFREYVNQTYFVYILDFLEYKNSTGRKSISLEVCSQKGLQVHSKILLQQYD
jgi:penicillin-binding protein-related factor A (putative recombinase)